MPGLSVTEHPEFSFTAADFGRIRRILHGHCGISLGASKRSMVYSRLARRLRACNVRDFGDYLDIVERDSAEREQCMDALMTHLTSFFREPHHFDIMADYVRRRNYPRLRIWCAAASTGEEPYSIAMTMVEAYNTETPPVEIIASDVDPEALAHAQRGVFMLERLQKISDKRQSRFFQRGDGPNAGFARVRPLLRTMIDYRQINLQSDTWPVPSDLDIIICRNVLLYFAPALQHSIVRRFADFIAADGLLITGAENVTGATELFDSMGQTVYRRQSSMTSGALPDVGRRVRCQKSQ
jgi:chemotaxis protein methyltransferase CheR